MELEELKQRIIKLMDETTKESSTLFLWTIFGDIYEAILLYCLKHNIKIGNYNLRRFFEKCKGINLKQYYERITPLYQRIESDFEKGKLVNSDEFIEIHQFYRDLIKKYYG